MRRDRGRGARAGAASTYVHDMMRTSRRELTQLLSVTSSRKIIRKEPPCSSAGHAHLSAVILRAVVCSLMTGL